jgi:RsmE family RNA methyltransferase
VNIILFHPSEVEHPLARRDPRAVHLLDVLRRQVGDTFEAGVIDGPRGRGTVAEIGTDFLRLSFAWGESPPPLSLIHVIVGLPRPQTARDILRDVTTLGVAALHFVLTDKGESSYARSSLWKSNAWRECVINGAIQAFCTRLPQVTHGHTLAHSLAQLPPDAARLALDNYEAATALNQSNLAGCTSAVIALGAERGWSAAERELLRATGFHFVHLGPRVLRTETACIAAVTLLKARLNWL